MKRSPGHLSRQGSPELRSGAFEAAKCAVRPGSPDYRYNRVLAAKRDGRNGKNPTLAVGRMLCRSYHTMSGLGDAALAMPLTETQKEVPPEMRCTRSLPRIRLMPAAGSWDPPAAAPSWVDVLKRMSGRGWALARTTSSRARTSQQETAHDFQPQRLLPLFTRPTKYSADPPRPQGRSSSFRCGSSTPTTDCGPPTPKHGPERGQTKENDQRSPSLRASPTQIKRYHANGNHQDRYPRGDRYRGYHGSHRAGRVLDEYNWRGPVHDRRQQARADWVERINHRLRGQSDVRAHAGGSIL